MLQLQCHLDHLLTDRLSLKWSTGEQQPLQPADVLRPVQRVEVDGDVHGGHWFSLLVLVVQLEKVPVRADVLQRLTLLRKN